MVFEGSSAAISHTGKVRSNNQDSGYSGANLFVVADGMGGHAGGDVASTLAVTRIEPLDQAYTSTDDAQASLQAAATTAAADLVRASKERPELAGLGTTLSAIIMVDDYAVIGHIGDSRIYLYRDDALTQITTDHTFVQRLVDSGRITLEEARYHPRRSVLMRVLSDMDIAPDLDMFVMPTQPGDRWLLCSDGLSGVVDDPPIAKAMALGLAPGRTADILLKQALDGGAPDNVTLVIVDVGGAHPLSSGTGTVVGAASNPADLPVPAPRASLTGWLHPARQAANEPSHFEPDSDYFEEIIEEDRRRARRRRMAWLFALFLAVVALVGAGFLAYNWTQTRYFVGADEDSVVIYRGVQQSLGPISLSTEVHDTNILLADLPSYQRAAVERTINARSLSDATAITERLRASALPAIPEPEFTPDADPTPTPTPTATTEAPTP
ncbi:Protein serine/threonine phosphatase PrpC, regulation of stationary phase [Microbacterium esteraromaticum]|uniref:Protein serine/threonine phosphatase PrpC, regulation of stationary phase n=1 Tax=Microbacterium esteraromaticum TaxID=57043 RepID=A0A1R4JZ29_9MICO|nr:protein phosphatase 2C domain-containing protein [Microbacterium esteraromaticum]SJN37242.1 Protein serine/threonine phosphatase PrpC, regulation of stationary phase [Microbacterium esteraromaticum]